MGLPYPGGVQIDRAAREGDAQAFRFPRAHVDGAPYDFSFSGLKTAVINTCHQMQQKGQPLPVADLAASLQAAISDALTEKLMLAAAHTKHRTIVLAGGVSANSGLRARVEAACRERGYTIFLPPLALCGDNAAMVGAQGFYEWRAGHTADASLNARATMDIAEPFAAPGRAEA